MRLALSAGLLALSVMLLSASQARAGEADRHLQKRLSLLEKYASRGPSVGKLPPDMAIYRYVGDSLYAWSNQFPIRNDDISRPVLVERFPGPRSTVPSPLVDLPDTFTVVSMGDKAYLVRAVRNGPETRIEGLELTDRSPGRRQGKVEDVLLHPVLLINLLLFCLSLGLWLSRRRLRVPPALAWPAAVLVGVYAVLALRSLIMKSDISLELYKLGELSVSTALVYAAFLLLLASIPLLLASARRPALFLRFRLTYSLLSGLFLMLAAAFLGFRKEQERVENWAACMAVERDFALESLLLTAGEEMAQDRLMAAYSLEDAGAVAIRKHLSETSLSRLSPEYRIKVMVLPPGTADPGRSQLLRNVIAQGTKIEDDSHFLYTVQSGQARYDGVFSYPGLAPGQVCFVLVEIEPIAGLQRQGYARLLGLPGVWGVQMPGFYSYAKYERGQMAYCQGSYAYPTTLEGDFPDRGAYVHFRNPVGEDGTLIVISRPRISILNYVFSTLFLSILMFLLLGLFPIRGKRTDRGAYFRTRINWVVMLSLTLTLVVMSVVSVLFVYRRNEVNQQVLLADKALMLQRMVQQAGVSLPVALERAAADAGVDLTLYAPDGRLVTSTAGEVFDRLVPGCRMDEIAFSEIVHGKRRYYTQRETLGGHDFIGIYAPIHDAHGRLQGILCSPYTERSYDFVREAVMHLMSILTVFIILLILARFLVMGMLDRIFQPLLEMGRKMARAGRGSLETIEYDRDDEISALVKAYNGMVLQLESGRESMAQAERDKAWSGMARQVAHEIKNPLTPMKLQLQRIIRLKEKGGDAWQDKFDEMVSVLLEHIDILTDTANEFSDFAKLYIQEPVRIDLNRLLEDEIAMFDGREEVEFTYFGLEGAVINGPKPQLTRVFVNLMNNSVQALEGRSDGKVTVSLRKSTREACYDIVFEDNGPGVSEENQARLFTPNFTTKNGGTGLGLAISKSVLDRCGATISYSRSFTLGGACFTVCYPVEST